jgi:NADH-quinone oxidoreductase subunit F
MATSIATTRFARDDGNTLAAYLDSGGYEGLRKALTMDRSAIQEEVKAAGLTGRSGGAAFLTAQKWSLLAEQRPAYVVVNGDESEPGFAKDRALMERDPHQLIEGSLICAHAVAAQGVFIYVRGEMALAQERVAEALNEAYANGYAGKNIMGSGVDIDIVLHWGAGAYIVGEETGLLESLEGKRGFPRIKFMVGSTSVGFPAVDGLYGQPTIVNNVETMGVLPWIVLNGGSGFSSIGANRSLGTRVFSLSGHVNRPGNYEVELASLTFREFFTSPDYGGGIREGNRVKAFVVGASFPWLFEEHLDLPLDIDEVTKAGSLLGSGLIVMDETTCAVRAAWRLARFYAHESCGQCTPCREGATWVEQIMYRIEHGAGRHDDLDLLYDVCDNISPGFRWPPVQTTICQLGVSIHPAPISALTQFKDEFVTHINLGRCPRG